MLSGAVYLAIAHTVSDSWVMQRSFEGVRTLVESRSVADNWRTINWSWAMEAYDKHPLLGIGLGTFELYYDRHEIHSSYLSLLTEAGPVAMLAYIGMFVVALTRTGQLLLLNSVMQKSNALTISLFTSLVCLGSMGIFHNQTRHRHLYLLLFLSVMYANNQLNKNALDKSRRRSARAQPHPHRKALQKR